MQAKLNVLFMKALYGIVLGGIILFLSGQLGDVPSAHAQEAETTTPTEITIPTMAPAAFDFDEATILAQLIAIFNVPPGSGAFFAPIGQYETMLLGDFVVPAAPDSEGGPWDSFFVATQNGSEITIACIGTEAFAEKVEILYAAGAIDQGWFSILTQQ